MHRSPLPDEAETPRQRLKLECSHCERTFGKAEHLIRHERSHTKSQPYECRVCHRRFSRQDSLARHLRLHQRVSESPFIAPADVRSPQRSSSVEPMTPLQSPPERGHPISAERGTPSDGHSLPGTVHTPSMFSDPDALRQREVVNESMPPSSGSGFEPFGLGGVQLPTNTVPLAANIPNDDVDLWQLLSCDLLPGSTSLRASPDFLDILGLGTDLFSNRPPISESHHPDHSLPRTESEFSRRESSTQREPSLEQNDSQTTSWMYSRANPMVSAERFRASNERSPAPVARSQQAVNEARLMISDLSTRVTNDVSPLSSHWLDLCLHMFWKKFTPVFPIMHQPTFNVRTTCAPLLLNMIAIGSLCLHSPDDRQKGVALWRLVHKGVAGNWDKLIEIQGPYDECRGTQLILTSALGQIFAMMSGHPDLESTAHVFHGNGFRWAKLAGIFDLDLRERPLPSGVNEVETERAWAQWAARETQKRALLAHYIIDGLLMSMGDSGTSTKHMLNPFLVAADDHLFMASTAASWRTQYRSSSTSTTIADVYRDLFCPDERVIQLPPSSPFTAQTVLEGLHSLIMDLEESQALSSLPVGCVEMPDIARALDRFYQLYLDDAPNTLVLGARWHVVCIKACRAVHMRTPTSSHADWFSLPCGRRALLHANAIRLVAARLPIAAADMPHFSLPVSLYDAAKVFLRHLASTALGSPNATAVRLEEPTDWALLGTTGLVSRPGPGGPDGRGADAATSGIRQGTIRSDAAGARVLSSDQWASFVENSGTVSVNGMELGTHELYALTTGLSVFGHVWPRSTGFAHEIQSRVL